MSFALTTRQIRDRTKVVTRRTGWLFLEVGDQLQAVVKVRGLKRGEKVERICVLRVDRVHRERLEAITAQEVIREGFPDGNVVRFVEMYLNANGGTARQFVTRIGFSYVD